MKQRRIIISSVLFFALFTKGRHPAHSYRVLENPIPDDAKLIDARVQHNPETGEATCIELLVESSEFSAVELSAIWDEIPLYEPGVERVATLPGNAG